MIDDPALAYREMVASTGEPPARAASAVRLGDAIRHLARVVTGSHAPDDLFDQAAALVERLADQLAPHAEPSRYQQSERLGGAAGSFLTHPIVGPTNPCAPPVRVRADGDRMVGLVVYGPPFEGPPGFAHGGHIAAGFDVILAMAAGINGRGGLTKSLSVRYVKPAPLNTELVYEAQIDGRDERSTTVKGILRAGDVICAEGVGQFVRRPPLA